MKKKAKTKTERLYPIFYNGKKYYKKDCDDIFTAFYHTRDALGFNCSVYVAEGRRVCPDGTWEDA